MANLVTYRHVWTHRNRWGDWEYGYDCTWSDGSVSHEFTLPWGRMGGAIEVFDDVDTGTATISGMVGPDARPGDLYGGGQRSVVQLVPDLPGPQGQAK